MQIVKKKLIKRLFDLTIAIPSFLICSPIMVFIGVCLWFLNQGQVYFRQSRPGLHGQPFTIIKFCTMTDCRDKDGCLLPDYYRLTSLGKFLRTTSLDELPEIFNVLRGDMSIVGPRPLLMRYLERYTPEQKRRHELKPGITGWAQINGRNALTWEERFKLDVWYIDNHSLSLDIKIFALTIWRILKREGINQPGQATAEEFLGSLR